MAIVKRLTEEELALIEIFRHPSFCGEFIRGMVEEEGVEVWEYTDYQLEFLCDAGSFISITAGRSVGKTVTLIDRLVWYCINLFWDESIVYTVPNRVHLEPVFLRLTRWFRNHPLLKFYTGRTGINSQSFTIKLFNNAVIDCRIAGQSGTGANVVGLHIPIIILDEGGFYPWGTWIELQPTLNTWQEGYQMIVSGVPTGTRDKNVLYFTDQKDTKFNKHRVSAHQNPRYTDDDEIRNLRQYGGAENEDYIHMVLGQHGVPTFALFDRERMLIQDYDVFRATLYGQKIKDDPMYLPRFYNSLPPMVLGASKVMFGVDLGYTDPTIIIVLYKSKEGQPWRVLCRLRLHQVDYPKQEVIIDTLDSKYKPGILGIDEGSSGKAVIQHLFTDIGYRHKKYKDRLVPIQFRSMIPVGLDEDGKEVEVRAKQFGMQLLQSKTNNHEMAYSWRDETLINELERTTYNKSPSGELVFRTLTPRGGLRHGEDHNVSALLCFVIALYLVEDASQFLWTKKVKLYRTRWF